MGRCAEKSAIAFCFINLGILKTARWHGLALSIPAFTACFGDCACIPNQPVILAVGSVLSSSATNQGKYVANSSNKFWFFLIFDES
jgi:hypothetical protein